MVTNLDALAGHIGEDNAFLLADCVDVMAVIPDKSIDLAIVDPPYGINTGKHKGGAVIGGDARPFGGVNGTVYGENKKVRWDSRNYHIFSDDRTPDELYFRELERVSKHRIIWGGNFFLNYLGRATCMIVWDKKRRNMTQADCEIAWTDLRGQSRVFEWKWNGMLQQDMKHKEKRIHPTQKPVALYDWILSRWTRPGDVILDTHVGSASSLIACRKAGLAFVGCEKDEIYYRAAVERLEQETAGMEAAKREDHGKGDAETADVRGHER